jgi:pimeloyl-ACP methyl ester carboxylesterase
MRRDGSLLATVRQIRCPVVAIHGEDDPHPAAGVQGPLATALGDFRFLLIPRCGHTPWIERQAQRRFYDILDAEIRGSTPPIGTP